jgi:hypothetical protein
MAVGHGPAIVRPRNSVTAEVGGVLGVGWSPLPSDARVSNKRRRSSASLTSVLSAGAADGLEPCAEERKDGNQSPFFRLESPDREDG